MQTVGSPCVLACVVEEYGIGRHGRILEHSIRVGGAAESSSLHDGHAGVRVEYGVAFVDRVVVVEIVLVFVYEFTPRLIGGHQHPVGAVLIVQTGIKEVVVEEIVLLTEHRVEVDGTSIHDAAFHALAGLELLAVEMLIIKETIQTVQLSIATHILKHVREVVNLTAHGKQHTIAIEFVAAGQRTVANLAGSEQNVLAVHHHDGVVAGLRHGVVVQCDMVLQKLLDGAVVFVVNLTLLGMIGSNEFVGLFLGETTVGRRKDGERLCRG